jgi:hypothetical protein
VESNSNNISLKPNQNREKHIVKPLTFLRIFVLTLIVLHGAILAIAGNIGVIADRSENITVFDADELEILATIPVDELPIFDSFPFDVLILPDQSLAFVTENKDFAEGIYVIDLEADPPALDGFISVSSAPTDLTLSADGNYLLTAGAFAGPPPDPTFGVSVVSIEDREEVDTWIGDDDFHISSVEACADGSVLVVERETSSSSSIIRLEIDEDGILSETDDDPLTNDDAPDVNALESTSGSDDNPVFGIYCSRRANQEIGTFEVDGMTLVDTAEPTGPFCIDMVLSKSNTWLYVRSKEETLPGPAGAGDAYIDAFELDPETGEIGELKFTIELDRKPGTAFGAEQMALNGSGTKLYVSGLGFGGGIRIYHAKTGRLLDTLDGSDFPGLLVPTGIAVDGPPDSRPGNGVNRRP